MLLLTMGFQLRGILEVFEANVTGQVDNVLIEDFLLFIFHFCFCFWFWLIVRDFFLNLAQNTFHWFYWLWFWHEIFFWTLNFNLDDLVGIADWFQFESFPQ
jgi:hypothetical protein